MVVNAGDGPGVDFFFAGPYTVAILREEVRRGDYL
jgi:hypothetical protein